MDPISATLVGTAAVGVAEGAAGAVLPATAGLIGTGGVISSGLTTAAALGSTALSAVGAIGQSRAQAASAGYNAQVAQQNAQIQTQNANFAGSEGDQNEGIQGAKTRAAVAATLANQGASGVDVNSGSSVDTRASEAKLGALDALTIRSNAAKQAYGFQVNSASATGQSQLDKAQQSYDTTSGYVNAGSTVLGGLGNAAKYSKWLSTNGLG